MTSVARTPAGVRRLQIVGVTGGTSIGASLLLAARRAGLDAQLADMQRAFDGPRWLRAASWHLLGHRPLRIGRFGHQLLAQAGQFQPQVLLTTGLAPVSAGVLQRLGAMGIRRINYLTDDPWNSAHRAPWFMKALPHYDMVYSPRRANIADLRAAGCARVHFLPFAYDPAIFHAPSDDEYLGRRPLVDVVFVGGADDDRVVYFEALAKAGLTLSLYGSYWSRYPTLRAWHRGVAEPDALPLVLASAKVGLCLVRRANRDGNSMRSFEVPAVGTCVLAEDTSEHREIFGPEGAQVLYFGSADEMVHKCRRLCDDDALRQQLARAVHQAMLTGGHTWDDRLACMLAQREWDGGHG